MRGADPQSLNAVLAEAGVVSAASDLLGTNYERRGDEEHLTFLVSAGDLDDAVARAKSLAVEVLALIEERFGPGTLEFEDDQVMTHTELLGRGLVASDLGSLLDRIEEGPQWTIERPSAQLIRRVRTAIGSASPKSGSMRVRLGRVWTPCEPRPEGSPAWRMRSGRDVGLPRTAELATIAGVRFEVAREGVAEFTAILQLRCQGTGWTAVCHVGVLEEWLGRRGFATTRRHGHGEASVMFLPVADPLDLLWFQGTSGASAGLGTDELVGRLRAWRPRCDMAIVDAGESALTLYFHRLPEDLTAFAAEMVVLCPGASAADFSGQAIGPPALENSFQDLARALQQRRCLRLVWD
ncbi:hypothetical protein Pla86_25490 [Planctomycetes bacterium Pla86]|uniref:DUF4253 domain-containing protein n=1 Tax=Engelhardtia mirabilis TaxID=2528011 RepID=A0A518BKG5_9BACT|nr:hypothetical protein Pla133_25500 [Planctomycetes bacterium Pla133]QDV01793.1 hypothetical protein Pla86_25490 [Planctomycetes bacterium Pla86]